MADMQEQTEPAELELIPDAEIDDVEIIEESEGASSDQTNPPSPTDEPLLASQLPPPEIMPPLPAWALELQAAQAQDRESQRAALEAQAAALARIESQLESSRQPDSSETPTKLAQGRRKSRKSTPEKSQPQPDSDGRTRRKPSPVNLFRRKRATP